MESADKEKMWKDIQIYVKDRIDKNQTEMHTNNQRKKFWLKGATNTYIRVQREDSNKIKEDIPKNDFIDIWLDLNNPRYSSAGYLQRDLQNGNNRHSAVSFTLISKLPYIRTKKIRNGLRFFLDKSNF